MSSLRYAAFGHRLPQPLAIPLFGDRRRYGQKPFPDDPCWRRWQEIYDEFNMGTQHSGAHRLVNYSGYRVMKRIDLSGRRVLELGAGNVGHMPWWRGRPAEYHVLDVNPGMLAEAEKSLSAAGVQHSAHLQPHGEVASLPFPDAAFDVVVSFYSLEHMHPLESYVTEVARILAPGGHLIGAVPTEGGLGWGLARFLTSRRWFKKNTDLDFDKLICWEHPNFAGEIARCLDSNLSREHVSLFPFPFLPLIDPNLILRFVYQKAP